jgi:hypothetical protein
MMSEAISVMRVIHIVTAILMAWPVYALVAVNQRVRLGPPLGDRTDTYMENIIKNRTIPCFVFQGTALVSGLALMALRGQGLDGLIINPILGLKFVLLVLIIGLLSYVHFTLQPQIDQLLDQPSNPIEGDVASKIGSLRGQRKRIASVCMFVVLTVAMLGMQVYSSFPLWLTVTLLALIALFTLRTYKTQMPYGWI